MCKTEILPFCLLGTKVVHMGNAVTRLPIIIKDKLAGKTYRLEHIGPKGLYLCGIDITNYDRNHKETLLLRHTLAYSRQR